MSKLLSSPLFLKRKDVLSKKTKADSAFLASDSLATLAPARLKAPLFEREEVDAKNGIARLKALLADRKCDADRRNAALLAACAAGQYDSVSLLLSFCICSSLSSSSSPSSSPKSKSVDPNTKDRNGRTPLALAVLNNHSDVVSLLLKTKASKDFKLKLDIDAIDVLGCAPIHYAVVFGDVSCFRLLADAGARLDIVDNSGLPLFYHAVKSKRPEIANYLIKHAPLDLLNQSFGPLGSTVLHEACANSMSSSIQTLVEFGANPNLLDKENRKPIDCIDFEFGLCIVFFLLRRSRILYGEAVSFTAKPCVFL
ncbi:ankyrin repeat-containing domain protein [Obelidium mucronatum]|nr:ankyrin repeat-containing domain protein [Obelidium mucronatum]